MKTDKTADNTECEEIILNEECTRARKTAVNILSYSDNTELRLREKLAAKGFSREAADDAVEYVISRGWLDEQKQAESALRYLAEVKLFGRRRILQELRKRGFRRTVIDSCDFDSCDFVGNCRRLWEKRGNTDDERTVAYLFRAGYSGDDIRAARRMSEDN
ncbi:MAG: regulatory protein RecX [Eubacteriales bacterium]